ncbi:MAG: hypothetical protein EBU90_04525 [Proteobacteria bacterium]|nr:hypothetical protein [Pseudomonadota bacterium]NBP13707.1 hypothetical protein [bacterium]
MRIHEVIVLDPQINEISAFGAGSGIGKVAGNVVGGVKDFWAGAKQGYKDARAGFVTGQGAGTTAATTGTNTPQASASTAGTAAPTSGAASAPSGQAASAAPQQAPTQQAPAPQTTPDELDDLKATIAKLNPEQKQEIASQLQQPEIEQPSAPAAGAKTEPFVDPRSAAARGQKDQGFGFNRDTGVAFKSQAEKDAYNASNQQDDDDFEPDWNFGKDSNAPSPGTAVNIGQVKQQSAQQAQAAQADKQTAQQQIAATQAANAAKAKQDAAIKAAKDAAMAKPAFQQTASDRLAIKQAKDRGIRESKKSKKKKVVAEFNSKFLGITI